MKSIYIADSNYRYVLGEINSEKIVYCFGINPSTATLGIDDPAIRAVRRLAHYNGFDSWIMLNLYPKITPHINELKKIDENIHKRNLKEIIKIIPDNSTIWVAWGNNIQSPPRFYKCFLEILGKINNEKNRIAYKQLGDPTKGGHPKHPLYKSPQYFKEFDMKAYFNKIERMNKTIMF